VDVEQRAHGGRREGDGAGSGRRGQGLGAGRGGKGDIARHFQTWARAWGGSKHVREQGDGSAPNFGPDQNCTTYGTDR
jgi:hypothetical protein